VRRYTVALSQMISWLLLPCRHASKCFESPPKHTMTVEKQPFSRAHIIRNASARLRVRHFTHARSIHYSIMKQGTKGIGRANDIDRVSRQSLKMEVILAECWHVLKSLNTISQCPDEIQ
jgi:hypothetical protein